jgi:hypothetical protein
MERDSPIPACNGTLDNMQTALFLDIKYPMLFSAVLVDSINDTYSVWGWSQSSQRKSCGRVVFVARLGLGIHAWHTSLIMPKRFMALDSLRSLVKAS